MKKEVNDVFQQGEGVLPSRREEREWEGQEEGVGGHRSELKVVAAASLWCFRHIVIMG